MENDTTVHQMPFACLHLVPNIRLSRAATSTCTNRGLDKHGVHCFACKTQFLSGHECPCLHQPSVTLTQRSIHRRNINTTMPSHAGCFVLCNSPHPRDTRHGLQTFSDAAYFSVKHLGYVAGIPAVPPAGSRAAAGRQQHSNGLAWQRAGGWYASKPTYAQILSWHYNRRSLQDCRSNCCGSVARTHPAVHTHTHTPHHQLSSATIHPSTKTHAHIKPICLHIHCMRLLAMHPPCPTHRSYY